MENKRRLSIPARLWFTEIRNETGDLRYETFEIELPDGDLVPVDSDLDGEIWIRGGFSHLAREEKSLHTN
jgi:hypothetical protein